MNINIENFEAFVDDQIIDRARNYLINSAIIEMEKLGDSDFNATVSGTENYAVNIVLTSENEIFTHQCTCPFNSSPFCKHKVAVLLNIKAQRNEGIPIKKGTLSKINTVLNQYNKDELAQLLITLAKSNIPLRKELLAHLVPDDPDERN